MSDRYMGTIEIGGRMSQETFIEMLAAFNEGGPSEQLALEETRGGYLLRGEEYEARNGEFLSLEDWLRKNKVAFRRDSEAYSEYPACTATYSPEHGLNHVSTVDGDPLINYSALQSMLQELAGKSQEDWPSIAVNSRSSWAVEFAEAGLRSATDLASFLQAKLDDMQIKVTPPLEVEGMTEKEMMTKVHTVLGIDVGE